MVAVPTALSNMLLETVRVLQLWGLCAIVSNSELPWYRDAATECNRNLCHTRVAGAFVQVGNCCVRSGMLVCWHLSTRLTVETMYENTFFVSPDVCQ